MNSKRFSTHCVWQQQRDSLFKNLLLCTSVVYGQLGLLFVPCLFFLTPYSLEKKRKTLLYKLQNIPKNANILVKISISVIDGSKKVCIGQPICYYLAAFFVIIYNNIVHGIKLERTMGKEEHIQFKNPKFNRISQFCFDVNFTIECNWNY